LTSDFHVDKLKINDQLQVLPVEQWDMEYPKEILSPKHIKKLWNFFNTFTHLMTCPQNFKIPQTL